MRFVLFLTSALCVLCACATTPTRSTSRLADVEIPDEAASPSARPPASAAVRRAEDLMSRGRLEEARAELEADPGLSNDPRAQLNLGLLLEAAGDTPAAERAYERAVELRPDFAHAHANLGALLRDAGDLQGSLAAVDRALALDASLAGAHATRAYDLEDLQRFDDALAAYRRSLSLRDDPAVRVALGAMLLGLDRKDEAVRELRQAIASDDVGAALLAEAGAELRQAGEIASAVRALERATADRAAASPAAIAELAIALHASGALERAEAALREALAREPSNASFHYVLAGFLASRNAFIDAAAEYERVLALSPPAALGARARDRLQEVRQRAEPVRSR